MKEFLRRLRINTKLLKTMESASKSAHSNAGNSRTYSFVINFRKYIRKIPQLEDVKAIYVSGVCIIAKNSKYGDFYKSKYVKQVKGKFAYGAGSHASPILYPTKDTQIIVHNFPKKPELDFNDYDIKFKSNFLSLELL
jgi:hypothetical protein